MNHRRFNHILSKSYIEFPLQTQPPEASTPTQTIELNSRVAAEKPRQKREAEVQAELSKQRVMAQDAAIKLLTPYLAIVKRQREYQLADKLVISRI
jgi:hypothetical protein